MSDYEFRCPECKRVTNTHSTGNLPESDEEVECFSCGRISIVNYSLTRLFVIISDKKNSPSEVEKLKEQLKLERDVNHAVRETNSQVKKDGEVSLTNRLDTRSKSGEDALATMPEDTDNQPAAESSDANVATDEGGSK